MAEIAIEKDGVMYRAEYEVIDDTLVVMLPNGSRQEVLLRGLKPHLAARPLLMGYIKQLTNKDK